VTYHYLPDFHELWPVSDSQFVQSEKYKDSTFALINNPENLPLPAIILPDLYCYFVIHFLQNGNVRCRFIGPRTKAISVNRKKRSQSHIFKLPGPLVQHVLGVPIHEFVDRSFDIADFWGKPFLEKVLSSFQQGNYEALYAVFYSHQNSVDRQGRAAQFYLNAAIDTPHHLKITQQAQSLGWSSRYLRKIAQKHLGMPPKMVQRIARLQKSLAIKSQNSQIPYSHLALESGYYDQSHMIADYRDLLGKSPGILFG
jgi:AraC-like DNA-binding protein